MNSERFWTITVRANLAPFACAGLVCVWAAVPPAALAQHRLAAQGTLGEDWLNERSDEPVKLGAKFVTSSKWPRSQGGRANGTNTIAMGARNGLR